MKARHAVKMPKFMRSGLSLKKLVFLLVLAGLLWLIVSDPVGAAHVVKTVVGVVVYAVDGVVAFVDALSD